MERKTIPETNPTQKRPYPLDQEGRIARLEGVVEQIDVRLGRMETKIDAVDARIDTAGMSLEARINGLYRWVVTLQVATVLAIAGLAINAFSA